MIKILYENANMVFCIKPAGVSSEEEMTLKLKEQLNCEIYALHRLDKPVSGVMVYAKTKGAAADISRKIASGDDFKKEYLVACEGEFSENEGTMADLLFKDSSKNKSFVVKRERKGVKKASVQSGQRLFAFLQFRRLAAFWEIFCRSCLK